MNHATPDRWMPLREAVAAWVCAVGTLNAKRFRFGAQEELDPELILELMAEVELARRLCELISAEIRADKAPMSWLNSM